jgi:hypothetical protein
MLLQEDDICNVVPNSHKFVLQKLVVVGWGGASAIFDISRDSLDIAHYGKCVYVFFGSDTVHGENSHPVLSTHWFFR